MHTDRRARERDAKENQRINLNLSVFVGFCLFCRSVGYLPIISSKQHEHNSADAIASYNNSFTRHDFTVRDTMIRAIPASRQQKPINPALIANAVFISIKLSRAVDDIFLLLLIRRSVSLYVIFLVDFTKKKLREITK